MVDTEICVDRITAMRGHDMNVVLAEARKIVAEKYNPDENDKQLGINYDKPTTEEFVTLINILKKSSLLKVQPNKRGKNKPKRK